MIEDINELIEQRIKKLNELKALGIDPYGSPYDITHLASEVHRLYGDKDKDFLEDNQPEISIAGRIIMFRDFGKASFAHLQDSSGRIQVYFRKDILGEKFNILKKLISVISLELKEDSSGQRPMNSLLRLRIMSF